MCLDFFFLRLANLLYLISFILILACDDEETTIMPSILIFFFFPFYLLKRWLLDSQRMNALWQESYRKIKVFFPFFHHKSLNLYLENSVQIS